MQTWYNANWYNFQLADLLFTPEVYSEPKKTSKKEPFIKTKPLTILTEISILDIRLGSKTTLDSCFAIALDCGSGNKSTVKF